MSKNFRRYYETAFDSKISKSDEDLLSADKHDAAIAHRLSNQLQLSASASSVRPCDVVVRASPSKPPGKSRLFGFLLRRRRRNSGGARGAGQYNNYRSSDSVATSSSLSLESITSDSLSSHSSESPRCYPQPHVLSPISDKSSLDAGAEISDYERDRRLSATAAAQIKTKPPQSLGLIKLNRDHSQHHGSDSGISVGSKPGDNYQELLDVPFDMPKLRRKQKSEVSHAEKSAAVTAAVATVTLPSAADECPPSGLPPFDMPKLRRKLIPDDAHNSSVDVALPFDVLRKRQMDSCARIISFDFEINNDDADHLHAYCPDSANVMDIAGRNVADGTFPERLEALPFDVPKLNKINSLRDGGDKKPDRNSLFLDVKSNDCAAVTTNNRPSLKTFQNKNQPNRPTLSLCNIKPLNFVEDIDVSLPLDQQCWYHGFMTRIEAEKILRGKEEGTYLVRGNKGLYALSIKSAKGFIHMRITQSGERNYLGQSDRPFDTIPDLIRHYTLNKLPAKGAEHVGLIRPLAYQIL